MIGSEVTVKLNNEDTIIRINDIIIPGVRVAQSTFGVIRVAGGVPGPPGKNAESDTTLLNTHIISLTPHPVYDDLPSMTLLFENGLI